MVFVLGMLLSTQSRHDNLARAAPALYVFLRDPPPRGHTRDRPRLHELIQEVISLSSGHQIRYCISQGFVKASQELSFEPEKHVGVFVESVLDGGFDGFASQVVLQGIFDQCLCSFVDHRNRFVDISVEELIDVCFHQYIERFLTSVIEIRHADREGKSNTYVIHSTSSPFTMTAKASTSCLQSSTFCLPGPQHWPAAAVLRSLCSLLILREMWSREVWGMYVFVVSSGCAMMALLRVRGRDLSRRMISRYASGLGECKRSLRAVCSSSS
jgi:hypothetical protein